MAEYYFIPIVATALAQSKVRGAKAHRVPRRERFWLCKPNAELDRAGDWLLENLSTVRAKAASRAHSR
jgi:hypothetical protein